jgi:hypothetical protein
MEAQCQITVRVDQAKTITRASVVQSQIEQHRRFPRSRLADQV